jgi:hypothetical protein
MQSPRLASGEPVSTGVGNTLGSVSNPNLSRPAFRLQGCVTASGSTSSCAGSSSRIAYTELRAAPRANRPRDHHPCWVSRVLRERGAA